ncbi:hypothetical protein C8Q76DRAFT_789054 [Earliella scabrosa]|nr:hypothetical protein C8Q76DRAFT_789054 [Earliella scabrosa]
MSRDGTAGVTLIGTTAGLLIYRVIVHQTVSYFRTKAAATDGVQLKSFIVVIFLAATSSITASMHICWIKSTSHISTRQADYMVDASEQIIMPAYMSHVEVPSPHDITVIVVADNVNGVNFQYYSCKAIVPSPITILRTSFNIKRQISCSAYLSLLVTNLKQLYNPGLTLFFRSRQKLQIAVIAVMAGDLSVSIVGMVIGMHAASISDWSGYVHFYAAIMSLFFAGDLILTGTFLLHRGRSSLRRMNTIVDTLIRYALCATLLFSSLAMMIALSKTYGYGALIVPTTHIYVSSVLVFLNSRDALRERDVGIGPSTILAMSVLRETRVDDQSVRK